MWADRGLDGPGRGWLPGRGYAITSLPAARARPHHLAAWIRGHWKIENPLHWARDVTFGEDASTARTGTGPHVMAALRNLVISILRLAGHASIAAALRHTARDPGTRIPPAHSTEVTVSNKTMQTLSGHTNELAVRIARVLCRFNLPPARLLASQGTHAGQRRRCKRIL